MKKLLLFASMAAILSFATVPTQTEAAGILPCGIDNGRGGGADNIAGDNKIGSGEACGFCDIFQLANNAIVFFLFPAPDLNNGFAVVPLLATFFLVLGGFYILIAAGRPNLQERGKTIVTAVVIGLLIVYTAWVLLNTVLTSFGVAKWTGFVDNPDTAAQEGWWQIQCGN